MTTMNISLPAEMKTWVEFQAQNSGRYTNTSDYVRDLIRKDQDTNAKIQQMQVMVTEGLESGVGSRTMQVLSQAALKAL
ncbi:type II toxin-antitoxin system ParD family antitoxin [Bathymodiolus heckerae thiotrophic gill symbiont]|uniref:type II toxin-antitoxin system ParD family antitoxin n=1 Tax=Bathymodiolus heckerae thiotrophic gill symbiont TaxID=1052212 RepID=UPI0010FF18D0|nr:type II toxin-antitoxin system ParD family antitoxin [Bathymodiolus heckerae thiotrophic gill symbiont]